MVARRKLKRCEKCGEEMATFMFRKLFSNTARSGSCLLCEEAAGLLERMSQRTCPRCGKARALPLFRHMGSHRAAVCSECDALQVPAPVMSWDRCWCGRPKYRDRRRCVFCRLVAEGRPETEALEMQKAFESLTPEEEMAI